MLRVNVRMDRRAGLGEAIRRDVRSNMMDAADVGFHRADRDVPVGATTGLKQSGVAPRWVGDTLIWGYTAPYAEDVEEGTDPHVVPIEDLQLWARRVLGYEGAAGNVQSKIEEQGTEAQPFVEPGFRAMVDHLRQNGLVDSARGASGP